MGDETDSLSVRFVERRRIYELRYTPVHIAIPLNLINLTRKSSSEIRRSAA